MGLMGVHSFAILRLRIVTATGVLDPVSNPSVASRKAGQSLGSIYADLVLQHNLFFHRVLTGLVLPAWMATRSNMVSVNVLAITYI